MLDLCRRVMDKKRQMKVGEASFLLRIKSEGDNWLPPKAGDKKQHGGKKREESAPFAGRLGRGLRVTQRVVHVRPHRVLREPERVWRRAAAAD